MVNVPILQTNYMVHIIFSLSIHNKNNISLKNYSGKFQRQPMLLQNHVQVVPQKHILCIEALRLILNIFVNIIHLLMASIFIHLSIKCLYSS